MTDRQQVETTYADLRPDDLVVDKTGKAWPIADVEKGDPVAVSLVEFWLCDPTSKVKQHLMRKTPGDSVTVSRIPSHADEAAKFEAEFPKPTTLPNGDPFVSVEEALANLEPIADPEPLVEYTATEYDAANTATDDQPISLPAFESMTPLEQRSHLYLLHGVFAADLKSREELSRTHADAHFQYLEGKLKSAHVPHVHEEA